MTTRTTTTTQKIPEKKKAASLVKTTKTKSKTAAKSPTDFQNRVYDVCRVIPAGKVATYGSISTVLLSSPRAVGQALRCNPYAPEVPCHRVIASTLELGGFTGSWGINCASVQKKKTLLETEGVHFTTEGKLINTTALLKDKELAVLYAMMHL